MVEHECLCPHSSVPVSKLIDLGHSAGIEEPGIQVRVGEEKGKAGEADRDQIPMEL